MALIAAALVAATAAPAQDPAFITRFAGRPAPALAAVDRQGRPVTVASLGGKVVVVNLWATWCVPCRAELPSLERLAARRPDLVVLAVSNDTGGWAAVDRVWKGQFPHLRLALAARPDAAARFGALALPYTLVVDRKGAEAARAPRAAAWDGPAALALIDQAARR